MSITVGNGIITFQDGSTQNTAMHTMHVKPNTSVVEKISFYDIPSWARVITLKFHELSVSGSDDILIHLCSDIYASAPNESYPFNTRAAWFNSASGFATATSSAGILIVNNSAANLFSGTVTLTCLSPNPGNGSQLWVASGLVKYSTGGMMTTCGCATIISASLHSIYISPIGTNFYDSGSVYATYEG